MVRVVVTEPAVADISEILKDIGREAGFRVSLKYRKRFESLFSDRLSQFPESCQARPKLGTHVRAGVVPPYLVIYRYNPAESIVSIIRVLHSRRRVTRKLLTT